ASTRARFAQPELNLGILAGAGANWRLAQLVGLPLARRMLYLGETLDADAALAAGLVDAVHEPEALLDAALAMAANISTRSWPAECVELVADPELEVVLTEDEPAGAWPAWAGG